MGVGRVRRRLFVSALGAILLVAADAVGAEAQSGSTPGAVTVERFLGAWELVDWRVTDDAGNVRFPYGEEAQGQITYSSSGRMSAHLMRAPERAGDPPAQYLSYWGGFSIDTDEGNVTHHVIGSTQASFIGTDQVRRFTFEGEDRLVLQLGSNRLTWARVR